MRNSYITHVQKDAPYRLHQAISGLIREGLSLGALMRKR
jgi:hypothetical protein